ncbi:DUF4838 domain-containing protein [Puteibacter caeruleilacunae]|nr:DUF4838 domain-containing protein [Puteibacter caeruleilacunae]
MIHWKQVAVLLLIVLTVFTTTNEAKCAELESVQKKAYRGVVVYPSDLSSLGARYWVSQLKAAKLNLLGIHTDTRFETLPKLKDYLESKDGQLLQQLCKKENIDIEFELHVLQDILPRDLFDKHPEYFRIDSEGVRQSKYNMCFHSEGAYKEIEKHLKKVCKWLKPTTHRYFFWTDDVEHAFCHCEKCRKYSQSELALMYENRLLEILRKIDPEATLAHLAYLTTSLKAPKKVKPKEGIFLEYAPIGRDYSKPLEERHINNIKENLEVFPAETAHILEYWLDVSMFSRWKKDNLIEIPWKKEYCDRDVEQYTSFGVKSVTCFGAWINADYRQQYGENKVDNTIHEYGQCLEKYVKEAEQSSEKFIDINILPSPKSIQLKEGRGIKVENIVRIDTKDCELPVLGTQLADLPFDSPRKGVVVSFSLDPNADIPNHKEAYQLTIQNNAITIYARSTAGLFYGGQTLNQLLEDAKEQDRLIPCCKITDYPDIDFRAVHLDLKHHLDHTNYYYDYIDRLARYKINGIIVELEDKIGYEQMPTVGAMQSISIDEWIAISNYAKERNIEISPLVQGLGHADFILKHEEFYDIREDKNSDWTCCPSNDKTYEMQFALYEDAIRATPHGKYVHIGGDEVGGLGNCALCKQSGKTSLQLQLEWLAKVCEFIKKQGRTPIFWDDMVFKLVGSYRATYDDKLPEEQAIAMWNKGEGKLSKEIERFPKDCIYMRWNYESPGIVGNIKALDWYEKSGLKVMAATAAQCTENMMPRHHGRVAYISEFSKLTKEKKLEGIVCTAWDDASPHIETHWRGYIAQAEYGWSVDKRTEEEFNKVYRLREFGCNASKYAFQDELGDGMQFWEQALLAEGVRIHMWENHGRFKHIDVPDEANPGEWSNKYRSQLKLARQEIQRYSSIKDQLERMQKTAVRNRYTLQFFYAINEYQIFTSQLLLALERYDKAPDSANKSKLSELLKRYLLLRSNLADVYAHTRHLHKGLGYKLSQNHHSHNANRTVNSDWIFLFESMYVEKVNELLFNSDNQ